MQSQTDIWNKIKNEDNVRFEKKEPEKQKILI